MSEAERIFFHFVLLQLIDPTLAHCKLGGYSCSWRFIWVYFIIISLRLPSYSFSKKGTDVLWIKLKFKPFSLIYVLT